MSRRILPSLPTADSAALAQASDAQADPGRKAEHDRRRCSRGQQSEIEQSGQCPIAQRQQLVTGLLQHNRAACLPVDHDRRRRRQQQLASRRHQHPLRMRPTQERGMNAVAAQIDPLRAQPAARSEVSIPIKNRYQVEPSSSVSPNGVAVKAPALPSFRALVSMTVARVPSRMKVPNNSSSPAVVKNSRPPSGFAVGPMPALPSPRPSMAWIHRCATHEAQGNARFHVVALSRLQPKCLDSRLDRNAQPVPSSPLTTLCAAIKPGAVVAKK